MTIKVTREQVAAARIVHALDRAEGRESDEWILRLINAKAQQSSQPMATVGDHQQTRPGLQGR